MSFSEIQVWQDIQMLVGIFILEIYSTNSARVIIHALMLIIEHQLKLIPNEYIVTYTDEFIDSSCFSSIKLTDLGEFVKMLILCTI